jgi:hypothetical protein
MLNQMDNDLSRERDTVTMPSVMRTQLVSGETALPDFDANIDRVAEAMTPPPPPVADMVDELDEEPTQPEGAVDSAGTPWDERIHSGAKTFLQADGTWKLKRGVDKALVAQITAELMGNAQAPVVSTPTPPSATPTNVNTPPPPVAPITETPAAPVGNGFRQLLSDITKAGLAPEYVQNMCLEVNGRPLPLCKDDIAALDLLRMSLGL